MRPFVSLAVLACALSSAACFAPPPAHSARELVRAASDEGLALRDPLALDREIRVKVEDAVGLRGDALGRLHRLRDYMSASGELGFTYAPYSYDATQAFHARRGDCMAYTLLFIALARDLDIPVYFVHVAEVKNYYERSGWFFTSSHVAVGYGRGPSGVVIDLSKEVKDWQLALYESIDDSAAAALYYNNVAVDRMLAGDLPGAEKLLSFLQRREPGVVELTNNLGVLLNREKRHEEALALLQQGIAAFPKYEPFYTNGIQAARASGKLDLAADLERRGLAIENDDPFFLFARGMARYQQDDFGGAARELEHAADAKPDSPVILGWLVRAYLARGDLEHGREAFRRARRLAPNDVVVHDLVLRHPELQ